MKVTLIFPPATDPRSPQLALACLAAYIRPMGIDVTFHDLDIGGIHALLHPDRIIKSNKLFCDFVQKQAGSGLEKRRLQKFSDHITDEAPKAIKMLQNSESFYNANDFNSARDIISSALYITSLASEMLVDYGILPIRYDVKRIDPQSLNDLIKVTSDPKFNLFHEYWEEEVFPVIEADSPDMIGISISNRQQIIPGLTLAKDLKNRGYFVVIGGTVFTKFVDVLRRLPDFFKHFADGIIVYEGETAIAELILQLQSGREFSRVPNFLYFDGNQIRRTTTHLEDVNSLPTPDFSGLPLDNYLAPSTVLPIYAGKGCYFNRCKFCGITRSNHISKKAYRIRNPKKIVQDVRNLSSKYSTNHFLITDETLPPKLLLELADEFDMFPDETYNFTGYSRLEKELNFETFRRISNMGMRKLYFGLESASQQTLDHMSKGTKIKYTPQILKDCRAHNINFHIFSIIGLPEEAESSAFDTFNFFIDNHEIIDQPGNSFDIHQFGLDLQSAYFEDRDRLGLEVDPMVLKKDFVISIDDGLWDNTHGLSRDRARNLIKEVFYPELRKKYSRYHNTPMNLWPGFEEYTVLYSDYYKCRPFPFSTAIPDIGNKHKFRLRWSATVSSQLEGNIVYLTSYNMTINIPSILFERVAIPNSFTTRELVETVFLDKSSESCSKNNETVLFDILEHLFSIGFLQFEWENNEQNNDKQKIVLDRTKP